MAVYRRPVNGPAGIAKGVPIRLNRFSSDGPAGITKGVRISLIRFPSYGPASIAKAVGIGLKASNTKIIGHYWLTDYAKNCKY